MGKSTGNCKAVGELLSLAGDGDVGRASGGVGVTLTLCRLVFAKVAL